MERCSAAGLGSTLLPGVVLGMQASGAAGDTPKLPPITVETLEAAATVAGIMLTEDQRKMMLEGVRGNREGLEAIRAMHLPNSVAPAVVFDPLPFGYKVHRGPVPADGADDAGRIWVFPEPDISGLVGNEKRLAFATVAQLAFLLAKRKITSTELTKLYISRLKRYDPKLHFVITVLEDRALAQAAQADREIAAGKSRGLLHGIPWGAKDLLAVKGYPTTWGAAGFEQQHFDEDAEVVKRLDAAGAVLVAKLSLGALAQGDLWFGGRTRNPWNPKQGSSGSSAGSASAVSAGCVAFAIGSETLGSISSPCTRCGVTGLRPTFGFVPRTGAMALSWSMDKLGPITRSVEDAALIMQVIHGPDGRDKACRDAAFDLAPVDLKSLRVGYLESSFAVPKLQPPAPDAAKPEAEALSPEARAKQQQQRDASLARRVYDNRYDRAALEALRGMGVNLIPVKLPEFPYGSVTPVLSVEAAAAFDELTRSGRDKLLNGQEPYDWPNTFRVARMFSGVDYVQAMRARSVLIEKMAEMFRDVDVIVTPSGGAQLPATNLSGHPAVIVPNGLRGADAPAVSDAAEGAQGNVGGPGTPVSLTFLGRLYDDARLLAFAAEYQRRTGFHLRHPEL
ncbi:amidase [Terriglobus aquaticus]|uniref:amidase n=1 Tax=Terriglobus aquaticus TaxID=940139 RepID=UPI00295B5946|nr:amidase [Terriglobus aquaticus]